MALFLFLILSLCLPCYEVDARSKSQLNKQQNFPILKDLLSISHSINSDDFDCVDIYKQPAFQHPLLKNHTIQLNPSFATNTMQDKAFKDDNFTKGCPPEKVPIYKMKSRHQIITNSAASKSQINEDPSYPGYHHYVTVGTTQNMTFHGASAVIGAYNLSLQARQYSTSQIWLQSGPPMELNILQVGVGVHPTLYGDGDLHLTAAWTTNGYINTGCFDNLCPGFVQVSSDFGLGGTIGPTTPIGSSTKYAYVINVKQDPSTGHWWLMTARDSIIGYWPKEIFTHLSEGSSLIRYGGETFAPPNMVSPPMGSGRLPQEKFRNSGFIARLKIVDSEYNEIDVDPKDMESYSDTKSDCYDLIYHGFEGPVFLQAFLYGGPGGLCDL